MTRLENLLVDTFIQSYESHLKKFNKILVKNKSIYEQSEKLDKLKIKIKIDTNHYEKVFSEEQKSKCLNEYNNLIELFSEVKKRVKLIDGKITELDHKELVQNNPELFVNEDFDYDNIKKEIEEYLNIQTIEVISNPQKTTKEIFDFIDNVEEKKTFLDDLKRKFKTERGVEMRALIESLKADEIIVIGNREFKNFIELFGEYLNRDIGTYQSINDANEYSHNSDVINKKLKPIISKHKQLN